MEKLFNIGFNIKYRKSISIGMVFLCLLIFSCMSFADQDQVQKIKQPINQLHETLINIMVVADSTNSSERYDLLKPVIDGNFNIPLISKVVLGRYWKSIDNDKKSMFIDLFNELTISTYISRFNKYDNQIFKNISIEQLKENRYLVKTELIKPGDKPISFNYIVQKNDEQWRIISVIAKGINDLALKRAEYTSIIKKDGFEALITKLEQKILNLKEN